MVLKLNGETAELLEEIKKGSYIFLRYFLAVPYNTFCFLISKNYFHSSLTTCHATILAKVKNHKLRSI